MEEFQKLKNPPDTLEEQLLFFVDSIVNQLTANPNLLRFISKNLSWGIFKTALSSPVYEEDVNFREVYDDMLLTSPVKYKEPEIMLFLIVELVSSTCYSAILYSEPVDMTHMKPYLYQSIRQIMEAHRIG